MNEAGINELRALVGLAQAIEHLAPASVEYLAPWRSRAETLRLGGDAESLAGERALEELALELRATWLRFAHDNGGGYLMSPPHEQPKFMPSGTKFQFDYDRSSRPEILEARGYASIDVPNDWDAMCMLFSSGMSAISTLVQVCALHLDGPKPASPPSLAMFGGYFETWRLLDVYHGPLLTVEYFHDNQAFVKRVGNGQADIVVIEPVAYDWDMAVFDLPAFANAWRRAGERAPRLVIVDVSLTADQFSIADMQAAVGETPPWLMAFVRSGLKLDQQGLELANVGVVELFAPAGSASPVEIGPLRQRLTVNRSVMGTGLSVAETAILEAPWFLSREQTGDHARCVFENNRKLAEAAKADGGIFARITHPALTNAGDCRWAVAPFVVFHLSEDTAADHGKLVAILVHEACRRGLCLELGSSFGFRGHRFEVIRPLVHIREQGAHAGLLKIAMGSRQGPSVDGVIELVNEISAFADWNALRDAYRDVPAYVKGGFGVYVARPPRP